MHVCQAALVITRGRSESTPLAAPHAVVKNMASSRPLSKNMLHPTEWDKYQQQ